LTGYATVSVLMICAGALNTAPAQMNVKLKIKKIFLIIKFWYKLYKFLQHKSNWYPMAAQSQFVSILCLTVTTNSDD
jgi:hypothetical protein